MAKAAVETHGVSIHHACECLCISETCYRYEAKLDVENQRIADWLLRLTETHRKWGFGLCYLCLWNMKGFAWNHKRVYREFELNLRIKSKKRIVRERSEPLSVPTAINRVVD